nr:nuclear envelope pore membrane protein POM 121C-like [Cavia porcellus]
MGQQIGSLLGKPVLPAEDFQTLRSSSRRSSRRECSGIWLLRQEAQQRRAAQEAARPPSAFRPLVGRRGQVPYVPRPGPLSTNHRRQSARAPAAPSPRPSCVSSTKRDAISSSYSSTGGLPGQRRRAAAPSHTRPPPGSTKDLKAARPDSLQQPCSTPQVPRKTGNEVVADTPSRHEETRKEHEMTPEGAGLGRRKIPLLRPRQGPPLRLPPPPELSFKITAEHIDQEKEAAFKLLNARLMGTARPDTIPTGKVMTGKSKNRKEKPFLGSGNPLTSPATATASAVHTDTKRIELPMDITPPPDPFLSGPLAPDTSGSSLLSAQPTVTLPLGSTAIAMGSGAQSGTDTGVEHMDTTPPPDPLPRGTRAGTNGSSFPSAQMSMAPSSGSTATGTPSAPQSGADTGVEPMDTTPPPDPLSQGAPAHTSGISFPSTQMTVAPPSGSTAIAMGSGPQVGSGFGPTSTYVTAPHNSLLPAPPNGTSGNSFPSAQMTVAPPSGSTVIAMGSGPQVMPSFGPSSIYVITPHNAPLPGPPTNTSGNSFPSTQMTVAPHSGSTSIAMGSGPQVVPSFGPSSIYVITPHNAPPPGPPTGTSGNSFPSPQMTVALPSGSTAIAMGSGPQVVPSFGPSSIYVTPPHNAPPPGPPIGTSGNSFPSTQISVAPPSGSTSIAMGSGPQMGHSFGATPIYITPPHNSLIPGPPTGTNGNYFPSAQVTVAPPSGSTATGTSSAPQTGTDTGVEPMDTTPPADPLPRGAPPGTSGNSFPSVQMSMAPPNGSTATGTSSALKTGTDTGVEPMDTTPPPDPLPQEAPAGTSGNSFPSVQMSMAPPRGSTATGTSSAPQTGTDTGVEPMDTTPPPDPLPRGAPTGTSGNSFSSAQMTMAPPSGSTATGTSSAPQSGTDTGVEPMDTTPPPDPLSRGAPAGTSGAHLGADLRICGSPTQFSFSSASPWHQWDLLPICTAECGTDQGQQEGSLFLARTELERWCAPT